MLALLVAAIAAQAAAAGSQPWVVSLDTGETLTLRVEWQKGAARAGRGQGAWAKAGKTVDKGEWLVTGSTVTEGHYTLERIVTEAEEAERHKRMRDAMGGPEQQALVKKRAMASQKMSACMAQNQTNSKGLSQCMAPVQAELNALQLEQEQRMKKARSGPKAGCELLEVDAAGGKLTGIAERCVDGAGHALTGSAPPG